MYKKSTPTSEGQEIFLKPQYKNFGACQNLGRLQAPNKQPRWANSIPPNCNIFGWNHFARLQAESEVYQ